MFGPARLEKGALWVSRGARFAAAADRCAASTQHGTATMPQDTKYGDPMHIGDQDVLLTKSNLQYLVRNGVTHIDSYIGLGARAGVSTAGGCWAQLAQMFLSGLSASAAPCF